MGADWNLALILGDRIHSIRINLQHIVLEDALTILSYASPYEVTLEVESASPAAAGGAPSATSRGGSSPAAATAAAAATSTSSLLRRERERLNATSADRICHPFYRSQSIADLAQVSMKNSCLLKKGRSSLSKQDQYRVAFNRKF